MASAFLGYYASITEVDLRVPGSFYESNLAEARFEIIYFRTVLLDFNFAHFGMAACKQLLAIVQRFAASMHSSKPLG